jgi:hypothetical protein
LRRRRHRSCGRKRGDCEYEGVSHPAFIQRSRDAANRLDQLGCVQRRIGRPRTANHSRGLTVMMAFRKREGGRAKCALGAKASDNPVTSAASGAMVDFTFAVSGVVAARVRIILPPAMVGRTKHGLFPFGFCDSTSGDSIGFS